MRLFRIKEGEPFSVDIGKLVGAAELKHLLTNCRRAKNQEFVYREGHQTVRGLYDSNPICIDGRNHGIVFTLSEFSDVLRIVNNVTVGNIATDFEQILGNSEGILSIKQAAQKAALSSSTILIQGESGTGKELFARAIHFHSERAKGPFIPINCSAIPEQLIESELFGYADGAFTGARKGGKAGKFELAHQGTLLLDEIGDMQLHLQAKLLRVLQERVIEKVGGKEYIPIDVRVIAATNKDLEAKMLLGEFRQDLFYRLNVIPLTIPPLRDRHGDIPLLVRNLLKKCSGKLGKRILDIEPEALAVLEAFPWPGNVRELENTVEYASNMCSGGILRLEDLPARIRAQGARASQEGGFQGSLDQMVRREIEKAISGQLASGKSSHEIAQALGISRATLYRKFKKYGLQRSHFETIVSN